MEIENYFETLILIAIDKGFFESKNDFEKAVLTTIHQPLFEEWYFKVNKTETTIPALSILIRDETFEAFLFKKYIYDNEGNDPNFILDMLLERFLETEILYEFAITGDYAPFQLKIRTVREVFNKLINDGYVNVVDKSPRKFYYITFAGKYFITNGGYTGEHDDALSSDARVKGIETSQTVSQILIVFLTFALFVSSVAPSIYSAIQTFQVIYSYYHQTGLH